MLKRLWTNWRKIGHWLGDQVARAVLTLFYFTVALPFGLLVRLTQDPLDSRGPVGGWVERKPEEPDIKSAGRLF